MVKKLILVTGATGQQGGSLIRALREPELESGSESAFHILALTRTLNSPAATHLVAQNVQNVTAVQGNLDSEESMRKIFEDAKKDGGVWGVFCVLAFPGLGANADGEEKQGKLLADMALEYGVSSFIFSSAERGGEYWDDSAKLDRRAKVMIERHIRQLEGLPWTILRPGIFMEIYEGTIGSVSAGVFKNGLKPTTTSQLIAVEDIGHVAAAIFKNPEQYASKILALVGETSTMSQQQESFKRATGKTLPAIPGFLAKAFIAINSHTKGIIEDIERVHDAHTSGKCPEVVDQIAAAKRAYPEMKTFEAWAAQRGKSGEQKKGWNQVSLLRLMTGRH
ncbi:NAD(P)-binding protein [Mycena rebaudengoi]|nr:NAD(P)-binding protein [Mycena rebaudengoi]